MMNGPDLSTSVPTQHMQISINRKTIDTLHLGICYKVKDNFVLTKTKQVNFHNFFLSKEEEPALARQGKELAQQLGHFFIYVSKSISMGPCLGQSLHFLNINV